MRSAWRAIVCGGAVCHNRTLSGAGPPLAPPAGATGALTLDFSGGTVLSASRSTPPPTRARPSTTSAPAEAPTPRSSWWTGASAGGRPDHRHKHEHPDLDHGSDRPLREHLRAGRNRDVRPRRPVDRLRAHGPRRRGAARRVPEPATALLLGLGLVGLAGARTSSR
ncbi:MAG: PEP-CTERM sorting domain-containing protein [Deltaproteobacteria bacterium]|nr:PEP-CTERM sorting domain-containing protein [Deltaproteobacteria bacterium]